MQDLIDFHVLLFGCWVEKLWEFLFFLIGFEFTISQCMISIKQVKAWKNIGSRQTLYSLDEASTLISHNCVTVLPVNCFEELLKEFENIVTILSDTESHSVDSYLLVICLSWDDESTILPLFDILLLLYQIFLFYQVVSTVWENIVPETFVHALHKLVDYKKPFR